MAIEDQPRKYKYPLALFKQAAMKLESFMADIHEIREDEDLDDEDRQTLETMSETSSLMMAHLVNMIREECGEEDFLSEDIVMDEIGSYPESETNIMDQVISDE